LVEPAKSARSRCASCGGTIAKGELRCQISDDRAFAAAGGYTQQGEGRSRGYVEAAGPNGETISITKAWYHLRCVRARDVRHPLTTDWFEKGKGMNAANRAILTAFLAAGGAADGSSSESDSDSAGGGADGAGGGGAPVDDDADIAKAIAASLKDQPQQQRQQQKQQQQQQSPPERKREREEPGMSCPVCNCVVPFAQTDAEMSIHLDTCLGTGGEVAPSNSGESSPAAKRARVDEAPAAAKPGWWDFFSGSNDPPVQGDEPDPVAPLAGGFMSGNPIQGASWQSRRVVGLSADSRRHVLEAERRFKIAVNAHNAGARGYDLVLNQLMIRSLPERLSLLDHLHTLSLYEHQISGEWPVLPRSLIEFVTSTVADVGTSFPNVDDLDLTSTLQIFRARAPSYAELMPIAAALASSTSLHTLQVTVRMPDGHREFLEAIQAALDENRSLLIFSSGHTIDAAASEAAIESALRRNAALNF
jgi:hypothetical protein